MKNQHKKNVEKMGSMVWRDIDIFLKQILISSALTFFAGLSFGIAIMKCIG